MTKTRSTFILLFVAFLWGAGFIATEYALEASISPYQLIFYRFLIATIAIYIIGHKKINKEFKKSLKYGLITGCFLYFGFIFQSLGQSLSSPSVTAFLTSINVIFVPIFAYFINKKKIDKYTKISIPLTIIGVAILTLSKNLEINPGDILSLICAAFFGMHIFLCGYFSKKHNLNITSFTFFQFLAATIIGSVFLLLGGENNFDNSVLGFSSVIYLGLISTMLCFFLQNFAQRHADETVSALVLSTESVFATIMSAILFQELFGLNKIIAIILIFLAIVISETKLKFLGKKIK